MKLYNDQRNAQVFHLFICLLLPYMFLAFFKPVFKGRCPNLAVVLVSWVWCQRPGSDTISRRVQELCVSYHHPELLELLINTSYKHVIIVFQEGDMIYTATEHLSLTQFSANYFTSFLYFKIILSLNFKLKICKLVLIFFVTYPSKNLPEDGQTWWPKHVSDLRVYSVIHSRIFICTFRFYSH
jgi:hypothetical protein